MSNKSAYKTLVLGASTKPNRYSNMASLRLSKMGYPVIPLGRKEGKIGTLDIETKQKKFDDIHTITMYLNVENQKPMYDYILSLNPQRIIFNPGSENVELAALANKAGIEILQACTLVLLSTGQFELSKAAMDGPLH